MKSKSAFVQFQRVICDAADTLDTLIYAPLHSISNTFLGHMDYDAFHFRAQGLHFTI